MGEQVERCYPNVLIYEDGNFNPQIEEDLNFASESRPIAAVSIFGSQSTGKSTLMNHLFGTNFRTMDASQGMHQTTKGIWVAKYPLTNCGNEILAIDTEGTDGAERAGNTKFEKQTALFALAVSDTVIINMICSTVNLHYGGNRPLLRIVFEEMVRRFSTPRKVNLVFVLRDKNKCPLDKLEGQLKERLHEIWQDVAVSQSQVIAPLEDYFNIKVVAMSNYEEKPQQFEEEVVDLKEWIISKSISVDRAVGRIPASGFVKYAKGIWDEFQEELDLDLPGHKITDAVASCNKIAQEMYQSFCENESWLRVKNDVESGAIVQDFGMRVNSVIDNCVSEFDERAPRSDEIKRHVSRNQLIEDCLEVVEPTYLSVLQHKRHAILQEFEEALANELTRAGVYVPINTYRFITEFQNQIRDSSVKRANWNQAAKELDQLESQMDRCKEHVRVINEQLELEKRDRLEFWMKIASIGGNVTINLIAFVGCLAMFFGPGRSAATGTIIAVMQILTKLLDWNIQRERANDRFMRK